MISVPQTAHHSSAKRAQLLSRQLFRFPLMARLANFTTQTPYIRDAFKALAGIAPQRQMPPFARQSFLEWFARRDNPRTAGAKVILWPDTFNTYFHPNTAQAAVEVLEAAGFQVHVPAQSMCCGRPLYDYGFLDTAERWLKNILHAMQHEIRSGTPIVVLEPSCAAVFRDELTNLFPHNQDAQRLSQQTYLLGEFLNKRAPNFEPSPLHRKALVHGHCHHKSLMKMTGENAMLEKTQLDYQEQDSGCCGMAGAFGFEKGEHYEVSIKCGELVLLPAVRDAEKETLVVADGFSCREQIRQTTDREALHPAQIMQMALHGDQEKRPYPEKEYLPERDSDRVDWGAAALLGAAAVLIGMAGWTIISHHTS